MDELMRRDMILIFNEGIEQLVIPALEDLSGDLKEEMVNRFQKLRVEMEDFRTEVNARFNAVDVRFNKLERKIDDLSGKQVITGSMLKNHQLRLKRLESAQISD